MRLICATGFLTFFVLVSTGGIVQAAAEGDLPPPYADEKILSLEELGKHLYTFENLFCYQVSDVVSAMKIAKLVCNKGMTIQFNLRRETAAGYANRADNDFLQCQMDNNNTMKWFSNVTLMKYNLKLCQATTGALDRRKTLWMAIEDVNDLIDNPPGFSDGWISLVLENDWPNFRVLRDSVRQQGQVVRGQQHGIRMMENWEEVVSQLKQEHEATLRQMAAGFAIACALGSMMLLRNEQHKLLVPSGIEG